MYVQHRHRCQNSMTVPGFGETGFFSRCPRYRYAARYRVAKKELNSEMTVRFSINKNRDADYYIETSRKSNRVCLFIRIITDPIWFVTIIF